MACLNLAYLSVGSGVFFNGGGRNLVFFEEEGDSRSAVGGGGGSKPEDEGERGPAWRTQSKHIVALILFL